MPLPVLNTSGVDITNTVARINAMRTNDLQRQNLQSEITARETQAPIVNAVNLLKQKREEQALASEQLDEATKSTAYIADQPPEAQETLWNDFQQTWAKKGVPLPSGDIYKVDGVWNPERFKVMSQAGIRARSLQLDPSTNKTDWIPIKSNPNDPNAPYDQEALFRSDGRGKVVRVPDAPVRPYVDPVKKDKREETRLNLADRRQAAVEEANRIREEGLIRVGENAEKRAAINEKYFAALATAALMNAGTNKTKAEKTGLPKVKQTVKNAAGDMIHIMTDGSAKIMGLDEDGQPAWITATAEQTKGVTGLGVPPKKKGRFSGETKPVTKDILNTYAGSGKYKTKQEVLKAAQKDGYDTKGF